MPEVLSMLSGLLRCEQAASHYGSHKGSLVLAQHLLHHGGLYP